MKNLQEKITHHTGARVRFRREILNPDGSIHFQSDWQNNLILDAGLDKAATDGWPFVTRYAAVGTGTDEFERDSGATTASRTGTTVTASAGFFVAGDANSLIRWDTGEQSYIVSYTSATEVEVADSGTIASAEFAVYHVDRTGLLTESKRTGTYTGSPNAGTSYNGTNKEITMSRTYLFSAQASPATFREIGWSPTAGAGANLFGGALIGGGGDTLATGQQYKIVCQLILYIEPNVVTAVSDVGTGCNTAGNALLEYIGETGFGDTGTEYGRVTNATLDPPFGGTGVQNQGYGALSPVTDGTIKRLRALTSTWTQAGPTPTNNDDGGSLGAYISSVAAAYTPGNFYRDFSGTFDTATANGTIHGLVIGEGNNRCFSVKLTSTFAKSSSQTLTLTFRLSWQRRFI